MTDPAPDADLAGGSDRAERWALVVVALLVVLFAAAHLALQGAEEAPEPTDDAADLVAEALAAYAAAGEPVPIDDREWRREVPGERFSSLYGDDERAAASSPPLLAAARPEALDLVVLDGPIGGIADSVVWTADRAALVAWGRRAEESRRDPSVWRDATREQREFRTIDALVRAVRSDELWPCGLGADSGADRLRCLGESRRHCAASRVDDDRLPRWIDPFVARMELESLRGDSVEARRVLDLAICLFRVCDDPVSADELQGGVLVSGAILRSVEACAPLLGDDAQLLFADAVLACGANSYRDQWRDVVHGHRALTHRAYTYYPEMEQYVDAKISGLEFGDGRTYDEEFLYFMRETDAMLETAGRPYAEAHRALTELADTFEEGGFRLFVWSSEASPADLLRDAVRADARVACARVALEALRSGAEAATALAAVTTDPFDGAPLRTRARDDGVFEVWSVGADVIDDGGHTAAQRNAEDLDVVFRVPLRDPDADR